MYITDISLDVLQDLDISALRGQGIQPGEEKLPEEVQQTQSKGLFCVILGAGCIVIVSLYIYLSVNCILLCMHSKTKINLSICL